MLYLRNFRSSGEDKDGISWIIQYTTKYNLALAEKLCTDKEFPKDIIEGILHCTNKDNFHLAKKQ